LKGLAAGLFAPDNGGSPWQTGPSVGAFDRGPDYPTPTPTSKQQAIFGAGIVALVKQHIRGWIDLEHGLFLPARSRRRTKKQQPIPLPPRLLAHLKR